jgi:hypothetical protein
MKEEQTAEEMLDEFLEMLGGQLTPEEEKKFEYWTIEDLLASMDEFE